MRKPIKRRADFIVVGPLTEESQIVTGIFSIDIIYNTFSNLFACSYIDY